MNVYLFPIADPYLAPTIEAGAIVPGALLLHQLAAIKGDINIRRVTYIGNSKHVSRTIS